MPSREAAKWAAECNGLCYEKEPHGALFQLLICTEAAVLTFGGLLVQGAMANPQPIPVAVATTQNQTAAPTTNNQGTQNYVNGMINWMQGYFNQGAAKGQVTPQEQQGLNQMYSFMRQYSGVMYNMMGGFYNGNQANQSAQPTN